MQLFEDVTNPCNVFHLKKSKSVPEAVEGNGKWEQLAYPKYSRLTVGLAEQDDSRDLL